jgi:hypothetical protein
MRNAHAVAASLVALGLLAAAPAQAAGTRSAQANVAGNVTDAACLRKVNKKGKTYTTRWQRRHCANLASNDGNAGGGGLGGSSLYILGGIAAAGIGIGVATASKDSPGS